MRCLIPLGACALVAAIPANAETVQSVRSLPTGMEVRTDKGVLTLEPWSDSVVHVRFGAPGYAGNYNPAVVAKPEKVRFAVRETPGAWLLSTARLRVQV